MPFPQNSYSVRYKGVSVVNEEVLEIGYLTNGRILCLTPSRVIVATGGLAWYRQSSDATGRYYQEEKLQEKKEKLYRQSAEAVLKADERNFDIPYVEIIQVELFKQLFFRRKIRITIGIRKHEFTFLNEHEYYRCMFALRPLLHDKLTVL